MWLHLKHLCATWLSLSSFAKKNGEKLVSRFGKFCAGCCGAKLSHSEQLSGKIKSRRAPSEANRPQGQQGHGKNYSGGIWTCSCPPASLSLWSSCVSCNNTEVSTSVSSQLHQICILCDYSPNQGDDCWVVVPKLQTHQHWSVQCLFKPGPASLIHQTCINSNTKECLSITASSAS